MATWLRNLIGPAEAGRYMLACAALVLVVSAPASAQPAPASGCETCHKEHPSPVLSAPAKDFGATDDEAKIGAFARLPCGPIGGHGRRTQSYLLLSRSGITRTAHDVRLSTPVTTLPVNKW